MFLSIRKADCYSYRHCSKLKGLGNDHWSVSFQRIGDKNGIPISKMNLRGILQCFTLSIFKQIKKTSSVSKNIPDVWIVLNNENNNRSFFTVLFLEQLKVSISLLSKQKLKQCTLTYIFTFQCALILRRKNSLQPSRITVHVRNLRTWYFYKICCSLPEVLHFFFVIENAISKVSF